jgi:hypothetical protein
MEIKQVFGENIIGKIVLSPKLLGQSVRLFIPETARKRTNLVKVLSAGPESGVQPGQVLLIKNDAGHEFGDGQILLQPEHVVGIITEGGIA